MLDADRALLAHLAGRRARYPDHPLAQLPAALGAGAEGADVLADRGHWWPRRPRRCRRRRAASATGTTGSAGCATPRFTLWALHALGLDWEADDFMQFVADLERNEDGSLQIMYGIDGEQDLTERTLDHLTATRARPGAGRQRRLRRSARTTSTARCSTRSTCTPRPAATSPSGCGRCSRTRSRRRSRSGRSPTRASGRRAASRSTTSPPSSCAGWRWTAARGWPSMRGDERGRRSAGRRWPTRSAPTSSSTASEDGRLPPALRHRRARRLDAAGAARALPAATTTSACARPCWPSRGELTEHGLVLRYKRRRDRRRAARRGGHVRHLLVLARLRAVRDRRGARGQRAAASKLLSYASPLQLYAEEIDADSGRHLGNYPQAFTHLALINAVLARHRGRKRRWIGLAAQPACKEDDCALLQGRRRGLRLHRQAVRGPRGRRGARAQVPQGRTRSSSTSTATPSRRSP